MVHFVGGINAGWGEIDGSVLGHANFKMGIRCASENEGVFNMWSGTQSGHVARVISTPMATKD